LTTNWYASQFKWFLRLFNYNNINKKLNEPGNIPVSGGDETHCDAGLYVQTGSQPPIKKPKISNAVLTMQGPADGLHQSTTQPGHAAPVTVGQNMEQEEEWDGQDVLLRLQPPAHQDGAAPVVLADADQDVPLHLQPPAHQDGAAPVVLGPHDVQELLDDEWDDEVCITVKFVKISLKKTFCY
jgi:hypothetical protein